MATSFTQCEISEQWIKMHARKQNDCIYLESLYTHFKGAGNTTRRIAEASRLSDTLHYKNERSLSFTIFLANMQHMFNLFEQESEPITEAAKLRFLLDKVNHPQLKSDISALRVKYNIASGKDKVTFTKAASILAASVLSLPDYQSKSRVVSGVGTKSDGSIHHDGKTFTGYYKNWRELSKEDIEKFNAERVRTSTKKQPKDKEGSRQVSLIETKTTLSSQNKELKTAKRQIDALRRKVKQGSDSDDTSDSDPEDDAGNSFG